MSIFDIMVSESQKQPFADVLQNRSEAAIQSIQPSHFGMGVLKCDFIKVVKQLYWNHTSAWVFSCKLAAYFQNTFH